LIPRLLGVGNQRITPANSRGLVATGSIEGDGFRQFDDCAVEMESSSSKSGRLLIPAAPAAELFHHLALFSQDSHCLKPYSTCSPWQARTSTACFNPQNSAPLPSGFILRVDDVDFALTLWRGRPSSRAVFRVCMQGVETAGLVTMHCIAAAFPQSNRITLHFHRHYEIPSSSWAFNFQLNGTPYHLRRNANAEKIPTLM
jgi:hypothetical protein